MTIVASNIIAFVVNWLEYLLFRAPVFLYVLEVFCYICLLTVRRYGQQYHGLMALQIGVLVGFTQIIPEHQVQVMGVIKARVKVCSFSHLICKYAFTILST